MHGIGGSSPLADAALGWSSGLTLQVGGAGMVAHAGVVLPRLLADQLGLTVGLSQVLERADFLPGRHRGRALVDATCALAAGATCLSDIEAMTRQVEIFGPAGGASDTTMLRVLDELSGRLNSDGLPGRRLAQATAAARAAAWSQIAARHGSLPAVRVAGEELTRPGAAGEPGRPVLVVRLDATLIEGDSDKVGAAGNYKGGYGFHPLTAWCTNVGDNLAVMLRPGNAGSFTASDHLLVLDAALAQIPAEYRADLLVTIDGPGAPTTSSTTSPGGTPTRYTANAAGGSSTASAGRSTTAPRPRWRSCVRRTGPSRWTRRVTPTPTPP